MAPRWSQRPRSPRRGFHQSDMMRVLEDGDDREQKHHHRDTGRKTGSRVDVTCRGGLAIDAGFIDWGRWA